MNIIIINDLKYFAESIWRIKKSDNRTDIMDELLPLPKEKKHNWSNKKNFIDNLERFNESISCNSNKNHTIKDIFELCKNGEKVRKQMDKQNGTYIKYTKSIDCQICGKKNVANGIYNHKDMIWEDSLSHYIREHNIKPSNDFIEYIYFKITSMRLCQKKKMNISGRLVKNKNLSSFMYYVKLEANQIMIMDALMYHGGYTKKYTDDTGNIFRYSEHSGLLDFNGRFLDTIVVSGNTSRTDTDDDDIFLPNNICEAIKYEYLFHTHPPTPKPGGRVEEGILLELPSIGDILHFIDHHNGGKTIGSLVMAPEGLYNIRRCDLKKGKINIDEDKMYKEFNVVFDKIQKKMIKKYNSEFKTEYFYSVISQDMEPIDTLNKALNKFQINIDFFTRKKDKRGKWVVDDIYLPIYSCK